MYDHREGLGQRKDGEIRAQGEGCGRPSGKKSTLFAPDGRWAACKRDGEDGVASPDEVNLSSWFPGRTKGPFREKVRRWGNREEAAERTRGGTLP